MDTSEVSFEEKSQCTSSENGAKEKEMRKNK
jgi:hypothetical protein